MKTKQDLIREVSMLKDRLEKAVVFEVTEDISIGISETDGLYRIRRSEPSGEYSFLNKNYEWERPALVDLAYSERTGYYTSDEAFDMLELVQNFVDHKSIFFNAKSLLKNN